MSRIFDALRRSEQEERQPGNKHWNLPPDALRNDPRLSEDNVRLQETESLAPAPGGSPLELPPFPAPSPSPGVTGREIASDGESRPLQMHAAGEDLPPDFAPVAMPAPGLPDFSIIPFAGAGSLPPDTTSTGLLGQPIDLSKLKVVPVASIPSPLLVALSSERGLGAEKFRVLGARLSNIRLGAKLDVLQVTSSVVGEGKTLTSVNLAMTLATRFAQKVLLAEGDLRKPAVCALLGMENQDGIGEWWEDPDRPISDLLLRIGDTGMCILPAGYVAHPASVLQSPRIAGLFAELARQFDWVIIDTPPLLPLADSNLWSRLSDGTLMVVRKGTVSRAALKKAVESIDNPKLVGIVLNDASDYDRVSYYDQYYTSRGERDAAQKATSQ
jgi:capsular exopolysaccharide synthesis family protein